MAILELHKNSKEKDAEHRLVVRLEIPCNVTLISGRK